MQAVGLYFACEKDMTFGGPGMECYRLNVCVPQKSYIET